ncbi:U11/U12 small nuclear ribonucleoprotein 65 kDa protein [Raphanus sativus]|nr:U11/U12 small nuclear ribonucleoprotein 65 kDa protein [Raphanus sativus]
MPVDQDYQKVTQEEQHKEDIELEGPAEEEPRKEDLILKPFASLEELEKGGYLRRISFIAYVQGTYSSIYEEPIIYIYAEKKFYNCVNLIDWLCILVTGDSVSMKRTTQLGIFACVVYQNLAKDVITDDFYYIFGSQFGSIEAAKSSLGVRLMQEGRMRGQAFLTFPSVEVAHRALNLVNGFVFKGKPMIIQFGQESWISQAKRMMWYLIWS